MDADLDTLATALYVRIDELLTAAPERIPLRPTVGIAPRITHAEMITLAVLAALLGYSSETRWLRYAHASLRPWFRYLPQQPGYNKRLRRLAATIEWLIGVLARDTSLWTTTCGLSIRPRSNAPDRARPCTAPTWPALPNTATVPATRATSRACDCT